VKIEWRTVGAFQENCYLVVDPATKRAVLIDPGAEADEIIAMVRASGATLEAIWLTHAHIDHIGAIAGVKRTWDVPMYMHPADQPLYDRGAMQAAVYGLPFEQPPAPDHELADGDVLTVGSVSFDVLHVPGHAPGHVAFVRPGCMLGGDLLFAGSIGRTDLPLADPERMMESLERVAGLPEDTVVYPGHGPATSIGQERATNPFLTGVARVVRR
jgi:glyoxylase-like metal-dependent hydrolase (beta-lactamase superfamily II)